MWQLNGVWALIVTSLCLAASQQERPLRPAYVEKPVDHWGNMGRTSPKNTWGWNDKKTEEIDECKCIPFHQCKTGTRSDVDGVRLIDISKTNGCDDYLEVCCKATDMLKPERTTISEPLSPTTTAASLEKCGRFNPYGVGSRVHGDPKNPKQALYGEFPWMVVITTMKRSNGQDKPSHMYKCGGSLIHRQAVLTAAHSVYKNKASELNVRAGEWDTQTLNKMYPHQDRNVRKIIIHDKFNNMSVHNDYAILILSSPVDPTEHVGVVCLPTPVKQFDESHCTAIGWGKDKFGSEGKYHAILKKVELAVVSHNTCENSLRKTRLGKYFILDQSFMCAGGHQGQDMCTGDGGSPLVCPMKNDPSQYVQVGIVSWGIGCNQAGVPGVYANVIAAREWIKENLKDINLDSGHANVAVDFRWGR